MSRPSTPAYAIRRAPLGSGSQAQTPGTAASGRSGTPLSNKPVMSLEEWERIAPLTDEQLQSITLVKEMFSQRPLPKRTVESARTPPSSPPRPRGVANLLSTPSRGSSRPPSLPGSPVPDRQTQQQQSQHFDPLHPESIDTPQQFHDHFTALTLSTEHEQDSLYRDHLSEVTALREKCDGLLGLLKEGEMEVGEMLKCLSYVEERSENLRGASEDLLEEQTHLLTHTSHLAHRLTFFSYLETAQKMLNNPGNNLVLSEGFLPMVKRLDECLGYLGQHRDFKDAELYLLRYQQCMTRSMTLIKLFFTSTMKAMGQEISKRMADKSLSETAIQALVYTKFVTLASSVRPLLAELEERVLATPEELSALLAECHTAWISTRQSLLGTRVAEEIGRMDPGRSDLIDLTRSGCSYLKQTCLDEFNLFKHFFLSGETQLYGFLEGLCDYLYDHLRPRILHESSLETLCSVCTVLQALMVQDVSADHGDYDEVFSPDGGTPDFSPYGNGIGGSGYPEPADYFGSSPRRLGSLRMSPRASPGILAGRRYSASIQSRSRRSSTVKRRKPRKALSRLHTEVLLKMVLQDAQTRLVFRAQAILQADVQYYAAKEGDLDYPAKLEQGASSSGLSAAMMRKTSQAISLDNDDDDDQPAFLSLPPAETRASWYPTLKTTLWVLSCLYTYVDNAVFEDLAQEALSSCRRSLSSASDHLGAKKDKSMDGKLFLVRHLLILKEMTQGVDLGKRDRAREWSGVTDFLRSLLANASTMLGYPRGGLRANEQSLDAKTDIDRELKRACEDLISLLAVRSTRPLQSFIDQCSGHLSSPPNTTLPETDTKPTASGSDLASKPFATPDKVRAVHDEFRDSVKGEVETWKESLMKYLQDEETVRVLLPPATNSIVELYRRFHDLVRAEYDFTTAAGIMTPSGLQTLLSEP